MLINTLFYRFGWTTLPIFNLAFVYTFFYKSICFICEITGSNAAGEIKYWMFYVVCCKFFYLDIPMVSLLVWDLRFFHVKH